LNVPDYFLPFILPASLIEREAPPKVKVNVPPLQLPECSWTPPPSKIIYSESARDLVKDLQDLRRAGHPSLQPGAPDFDSSMTLMDLCVLDIKDTPETLFDGIRILKEQLVGAVNHGAAAHPTLKVSKRALFTVQRKYDLLNPLVQAMKHFVIFAKDLPGVIEDVIAGADPEEKYGKSFGMREMLQDNIHKDPLGRPQDVPPNIRHQDKFMHTFGLSAEHVSVLLAREYLKNECAEVAELAAVRAEQLVKRAAEKQDLNPKSLEGDAIWRLEALLEGFGTHEDHPGLTKVGRCKEAARAAAVLRYANTLFPAKAGPPEKAYKAAELVEEEVKEALEFGVFDDHPDLMKAVKVGHHLRAEGVLRFAKNTVHGMGNRLGDAEAAAIKIEDTIKEALKKGVPVPTEELEAARKVAVGARETEGLKRREANRAKAQGKA